MSESIKNRIGRRNESIQLIQSRRESNISILKNQINDVKRIVTSLRKQNKSQVQSQENYSNIFRRSRKYFDKYQKEKLKIPRNTQSWFRPSEKTIYNSQSTTCYNSAYSHRRTNSINGSNINIEGMHSPQRSVLNTAISKRSEDRERANKKQSQIDSTNFSIIIHNEFLKYKISDYANFNYMNLSENVSSC